MLTTQIHSSNLDFSTELKTYMSAHGCLKCILNPPNPKVDLDPHPQICSSQVFSKLHHHLLNGSTHIPSRHASCLPPLLLMLHVLSISTSYQFCIQNISHICSYLLLYYIIFIQAIITFWVDSFLSLLNVIPAIFVSVFTLLPSVHFSHSSSIKWKHIWSLSPT